MLGLAHDHVIEHFRHPAILALFERTLCLLHDGIGASHEFHVLRTPIRRWQSVDIGGIAVEEAQVLHIDRTGIVMDRPVIAAIGEIPIEARGKLHLLCDLLGGEAMIGEAQSLIVNVLVEVPLRLEIGDRLIPAPDGPVVGSEVNLESVAVAIDRFLDWALQASASRTWAPRSVYTLCRWWEVISDMHRALKAGRKNTNSAGASVPGVIWNSKSTPSIVRASPVSRIESLGTTNPVVPRESAAPRPVVTNPVGEGSSRFPYI